MMKMKGYKKESAAMEDGRHRFFLAGWMMGWVLLLSPGWAQAPQVFDGYRGGGAAWLSLQQPGALGYQHMLREVQQYADQYDKVWAGLNDRASVEKRKTLLRQQLLDAIGGLPEKTPLNPQMTGTLQGEGFRVEKWLIESQPGFHVSACLFLPEERQTPAPAIIYCSGHSQEAFRSETYQGVMLNLVKKGFVVLAFDPLGQGERLQYPDAAGASEVGGPTHEHSYVGAQCLLTGSSLAGYMIHDGIRMVDFLISRPEVDASRIGITGRSGGGTQAALIAALEPRIAVSAPECYISGTRRLWESIGPQDAEQNWMNMARNGLDHRDLLLLRAPQPTLMLSTTRDFFSIQGARETFRQVHRVYGLYGREGAFQMSEDDAPHASTLKNREALYAFFQRFLHVPGEAKETEVTPFALEALQVSENGQVLAAPGAKSVFDLHRERAEEMIRKQETRSWQEAITQPAHMRRQIKTLIGYPEEASGVTAVFTGAHSEDGFRLEKFFLSFSDGRYPLPFYLIRPGEEARGMPLLLYLHAKGKQTLFDHPETIQTYLKNGYALMIPDVLGTGELSHEAFRGDSQIEGVPYNYVLGASHLGRSLLGYQVADIQALISYAARQPFVNASRIYALATDELGPAMLHHAALFDNTRKVFLLRSLVSYASLASTRRYQPQFVPAIVPGALRVYDLPVLSSLVAGNRVNVLNPVDASGQPVTRQQFLSMYQPGPGRLAGARVTMDISVFGSKNTAELTGWVLEKMTE